MSQISSLLILYTNIKSVSILLEELLMIKISVSDNLLLLMDSPKVWNKLYNSILKMKNKEIIEIESKLLALPLSNFKL